ncbi:Uma2 family endonuclease [Yinghuangia aomiensis]
MPTRTPARRQKPRLHADDVVLVVEIASPSTRVADRKMKPSLYAAAGIPHYWRLELEPCPAPLPRHPGPRHLHRPPCPGRADHRTHRAVRVRHRPRPAHPPLTGLRVFTPGHGHGSRWRDRDTQGGSPWRRGDKAALAAHR